MRKIAGLYSNKLLITIDSFYNYLLRRINDMFLSIFMNCLSQLPSTIEVVIVFISLYPPFSYRQVPTKWRWFPRAPGNREKQENERRRSDRKTLGSPIQRWKALQLIYTTIQNNPDNNANKRSAAVAVKPSRFPRRAYFLIPKKRTWKSSCRRRKGTNRRHVRSVGHLQHARS